MAVDMFIKLGDVGGESTDSVHAGEIDVLSWSWGLSQSGTTHMGGGGGSGKVNVQDINLTKYVDKASPKIMMACCNGKHYSEATLVVRKAGENPVEYVKIRMTDLLITSVSTGGSGDEDRLTENVTLNFAKVSVDYTPQKKDGTAEGPVTMCWNIEQNTQG